VLSFVFITKVKDNLLKMVFIILFLIPNLISITPNAWDMYKFFIFAWVPIAVISGAALARIKKSLALVLLLLSILTTASVITYNIGTSYEAASWDEYNLGIWVRDNTEERAVFLTYYSIHSPPTMIGGRLRVACYINWPYGHGVALDDINKRFDDVDRAYMGNEEDLRRFSYGKDAIPKTTSEKMIRALEIGVMARDLGRLRAQQMEGDLSQDLQNRIEQLKKRMPTLILCAKTWVRR